MSDAVPQTGAYMVAAYIVTAVILVAYTALLARRTRTGNSRRTDAQG